MDTLYNPLTLSSLRVLVKHSQDPEKVELVCILVLIVSKGWPTRHFVVPETVPARKLLLEVGDERVYLNAG